MMMTLPGSFPSFLSLYIFFFICLDYTDNVDAVEIVWVWLLTLYFKNVQ